jgi:hypothetical protein
MIECTSCGTKELLIVFSKTKSGEQIYLCPMHVPLQVLEDGEEVWLKDINQQMV